MSSIRFGRFISVDLNPTIDKLIAELKEKGIIDINDDGHHIIHGSTLLIFPHPLPKTPENPEQK